MVCGPRLHREAEGAREATPAGQAACSPGFQKSWRHRRCHSIGFPTALGPHFGLIRHIAAFAPRFVHRDEVPADLIETERRLAEETARQEGKPEAALAKIIEGRVTGFVKEVSLIEQAFAKDAKKTVKQILDEAGTAVKAFHRFRVGQ